MDVVNNWLDTLKAPVFDERLQNLASEYTKYLILDGDYMKKVSLLCVEVMQ